MIEMMDSMLDCYQEADWVAWSIDKPAECWEFRSWLRDLVPTPLPAEGSCREIARISRAARRAQFRQKIADGLRVVNSAKAAGFPIKGVTIAGVTLELGSPEPAKIGAGEPPRVALFKARTTPKQKVVL
jgi:hypothetical protein